MVLAVGPLVSERLAASIAAFTGQDYLYFFDAIAPVIEADSIDRSIVFAASRYGKGDGDDYLNCPMDREELRTIRRRAAGRREGAAARDRQDAVLRGLPADRGDGAARPRHAAPSGR